MGSRFEHAVIPVLPTVKRSRRISGQSPDKNDKIISRKWENWLWRVKKNACCSGEIPLYKIDYSQKNSNRWEPNMTIRWQSAQRKFEMQREEQSVRSFNTGNLKDSLLLCCVSLGGKCRYLTKKGVAMVCNIIFNGYQIIIVIKRGRRLGSAMLRERVIYTLSVWRPQPHRTSQ